MSENTINKDLAVTIQTEGALLTLTPRGLLEYYLPHAQEIKPGVWKGKSSTGKDVYMQTEVLAGALLDCKEKQLNPVTEIYLITSTSPDRKASHKVKYTVGLERMREMPGFLGLNSGLVVERDGKIERRTGRMAYKGDTVLGAWAKAYFVGMPEAIEHEVDLESCENESSPTWKERPGFMLLKVVEDELWRLKILPRMKPKDRGTVEGDAIILEAQPQLPAPAPETKSAQKSEPASVKPHEKKEARTSAFAPAELYTGVIERITEVTHVDTRGKRTPNSEPGAVTIRCEDNTPLTCIFWTRPQALSKPENAGVLIGRTAVMSFREKKNDSGHAFWFIDTLDILPNAPATASVPEDDDAATTASAGGTGA